MKPLAITGIGSISPLAVEPEGLLAALDAQRNGLRCCELEAELEAVLRAGQVDPVVWAGRVLDFDYRPYIHPMKARRLDHTSRMAVGAARQALTGAGLDGEEGLDGRMVDGLGVMIGTSSAGSGPLALFLDALFRQSPEAAPPFEFPNTVANAPAGHISLQLGLRGANSTLSHSEAVVAQTLLFGAMMIEEGRCSHLLAGACDEWNGYYQAGYCQLGALRSAPQSSIPTAGDGMLLSEGATLLVLEPAASATARGARAVATLRGVAVGSAPGEPFRWVADADRLEGVLRQALEGACMTPGEIGSVMLAANGVRAMEAAEAQALSRLFAGRHLLAGGVKGALGERAVSGAVSVAVAALAQQRGQLPPFAGGTNAAWPDCIVPAERVTPLAGGATLVVLYGSGGNYGAVVVDR